MSEVMTILLTCNVSTLKTYLLLEAAQRGAGDRKVKTYRRDLAEILKRSEDTVTRAFRALIAKGLIERLGQARYGVRTENRTWK
jgi:DNA-binding MarR family transcriptional regulator